MNTRTILSAAVVAALTLAVSAVPSLRAQQRPIVKAQGAAAAESASIAATTGTGSSSEGGAARTGPPPLPDAGPEEDESAVAPGSYDSEGRRDPFRPLVGGTSDQKEENCPESELRCHSFQELRLTAILKTPTGPMCMLEGGTNRTGFFARVGDKLKNGSIFAIDTNPDHLVITIRETIDDPHAIKDYRDYPWPLYPRQETAKSTGSQ